KLSKNTKLLDEVKQTTKRLPVQEARKQAVERFYKSQREMENQQKEEKKEETETMDQEEVILLKKKINFVENEKRVETKSRNNGFKKVIQVLQEWNYKIKGMFIFFVNNNNLCRMSLNVYVEKFQKRLWKKKLLKRWINQKQRNIFPILFQNI